MGDLSLLHCYAVDAGHCQQSFARAVAVTAAGRKLTRAPDFSPLSGSTGVGVVLLDAKQDLDGLVGQCAQQGQAL